ncbi:MAG TPA: metallophosphoesterase [Chitinophagales bacterium]|nr:metallophosphoesterase [Chitinophagales bacterium]
MRNVLFFLLPLAILIFIDWYVYQAIRTATQRNFVHHIYIGISISFYILLISALLFDGRSWNPTLRTYIFSVYVILLACKLIIVPFILMDDIRRVLQWIYQQIAPSPTLSDNTVHPNAISRSVFLSRAGITVAAIPFVGLLYGIIKNAYNYQVNKVNLPIANLPEGFEGMTIAQISDIHTGSFTNLKAVARGVSMLNELRPDIVFFTGDLVNNTADEALPYIDIFKKIQAPLGVFSITGNHDYGDYVPWKNATEKRANFQKLVQHHATMGWKLLLNSHHIIEREGKQLAILGVENWSAHARFHTYGNLATAHKGTENCDVKLLLSHDPSHWRAEVVPHYPDINAVFSGHTHGFQAGINWKGFKWSPAKLMYKEWLGLYQEGQQYLYVNPGYGFLGYPGRIGILPEITLFRLTKA